MNIAAMRNDDSSMPAGSSDSHADRSIGDQQGIPSEAAGMAHGIWRNDGVGSTKAMRSQTTSSSDVVVEQDKRSCMKHIGCCYCKVESMCFGGWFAFTVPWFLFFILVLPEVQRHALVDVTTFAYIMYAISFVFYINTQCANPGVVSEAESVAAGGKRATLSRSTSRHIEGFDHYCQFLGADIGGGNLWSFKLLLVLLAVLSTYGVILMAWELVTNFTMRGVWHTRADQWRLSLMAAVLALFVYAVDVCRSSFGFRGTLLRAAAAFVIFIVPATMVLLPVASDILEVSTRDANPACYFLILPAFAFAVVFWAMARQWFCVLGGVGGLTQKEWLRKEGFLKHRHQQPPSAELV